MEPRNHALDSEALMKRIRELQGTIDHLVNHYPGEYSPYSSESNLSSCRGFKLSRSRSCKAILISTTPLHRFEELEQSLHMVSHGFEEFHESSRSPHRAAELNGVDNVKGDKKEIQTTDAAASKNEMEDDNKILDSNNLSSISLVTASADASMTNLGKQGDEDMGEAKVTEPTSNLSSDNDGDDEVEEMQDELRSLSYSQQENETQDNDNSLKDDASEVMEVGKKTPPKWPQEFERQQRMIIELWHACHTSLVHRTFFFLLFKGDSSDSIYLEVELRRLSFMKSKFSQGAPILMEGQILTSAACARTLNREREMLIKQMQKKFSEKEREALFQKWGIALDSKRRRMQLANRLWMDTQDMDRVRESAALVAKLVGFTDDEELPKEMFVGPNFSTRAISRRSYSWKI